MIMDRLEEDAMISDDACPVSEKFIGRLYDSVGRGLDDLVSGLPSSRRGELAFFCYRRAHLRDIGVAIAATCELTSLIDAGGRAGNFLFDLSREAPKAAAMRRGSRHASITLPTITSGLRAEIERTEGADEAVEEDLSVGLSTADDEEPCESITISWNEADAVQHVRSFE
jgi:hypothetical protein